MSAAQGRSITSSSWGREPPKARVFLIATRLFGFSAVWTFTAGPRKRGVQGAGLFYVLYKGGVYPPCGAQPLLVGRRTPMAEPPCASMGDSVLEHGLFLVGRRGLPALPKPVRKRGGECRPAPGKLRTRKAGPVSGAIRPAAKRKTRKDDRAALLFFYLYGDTAALADFSTRPITKGPFSTGAANSVPRPSVRREQELCEGCGAIRPTIVGEKGNVGKDKLAQKR